MHVNNIMIRTIKHIKKAVWFGLFCSLPFLTAQADVNNDLGDFFTSLGYSGNVTKAQSYQDQEAGYYTGGSTFLRNQVKNFHLVTIDAPSFHSGCGGIDLFVGGFSFIKGQDITKFFQSIMTDSAGYGLNLALETAVPEIAHAMQYMQSIAQKMNNANMNSCETAEDLVGGLWPKTRASQQQVCQDIGNHDGLFSDWASARQHCTTGNGFQSTMQQASKDPQYQKRVVINKNLIWAALQQNGLAADNQLAELLMSLSGTVIYDNKGNKSVILPMAANRDLMNAIMQGGNAHMYHCDTTQQCLHPSKSQITISQKSALIPQVNAMILNLVSQDQRDLPLTDLEKGFLNTVSIPVLKFIDVALKQHQGAAALDLTNYATLIAKDLLKQYLLESLKQVQVSLAGVDYPNKDKLLQDIHAAVTAVNQIALNSHQGLQDKVLLVRQMQHLEKSEAATLSNTLTESTEGNA